MSVRILEGDALTVLKTLPDQSVQMCVTSPPYYGLRDYGTVGQIGLERSPTEYVAALVAVFAEVRRVLREDGTVWLNIGDSYARMQESNVPQSKNRECVPPAHTGRLKNAGLKAKDLIGVPWLLAFALRADGWYLRSEIIWHKPNVMPESVLDRPTKAHEQIFLLSKSERYVYDAHAIKEPIADSTAGDPRSNDDGTRRARGYPGSASNGGTRLGAGEFRNRRTVWSVNTAGYREAHFATFPPDLIEPCILAGSANKACEKCGASWRRQLELVSREIGGGSPGVPKEVRGIFAQHQGGSQSDREGLTQSTHRTVGFAPSCECENRGTATSLVLDPFGGAGTTGLVADRLGRDALLIELNPKYAAMARERIHSDNPLFGDVA